MRKSIFSKERYRSESSWGTNAKVGLAWHQDLLAWLILTALFITLLAVTWHRWTHPIVDHGREMNLPVRILAGERLYSDILYYYGPFAPYFNALLFRLFGIRLMTLHASGMVCAVLILAMIYWLTRQLMDVWESALATAVVMLLCALNVHLGNYLQPYSYAALYGLVFALSALVCAVRYLVRRRARWLGWAGASAGMVLICKPELVVAAIAPVAVVWALVSFSARRWSWRSILIFATPLALICGLTYGSILLQIPWQTLIGENYLLFNTPQMAHFNRHLNGILDWPQTGWALVTAIGLILLTGGLSVVFGSLAARQWQDLLGAQSSRIWGAIIIGLAMLPCKTKVSNQYLDINPFRAATVVLVATISWLVWQLWRARAKREPLSRRRMIVLVIAVFGLISIARVFLNISLINSYTPFTVPTLVVIYCYLLFRVAPALLLPASPWGKSARRSVLALSTLLVIMLAVRYAKESRYNKRFQVCTPRGCLRTLPIYGRPLAEAIDFVRKHTSSQDHLAVLPQGTMINFLAARAYPLREEILAPGFVSGAKEAEIIRRLDQSQAPVVLLINFPTPEYRDRGFGIDYNQELMRWIMEHYHLSATFSTSQGHELRFGDQDFFIRAYERNP
jgi:4-amino-4-deoxy-L-arabinose transferase-like glycosyltransferase